MEKECCSCHKTKERTEEEYKSLIHRLNRIEGQVRGIKGMVEKNAYCPDILVQVAAVNAALNAFNKELLANHCLLYTSTSQWKTATKRILRTIFNPHASSRNSSGVTESPSPRRIPERIL